MNDKQKELLYRSLDAPLTEAEQKELERALAESAELRAEKEALTAMRSALSQAAPEGFGPFFPEHVMARIRAEEESPEGEGTEDTEWK